MQWMQNYKMPDITRRFCRDNSQLIQFASYEKCQIFWTWFNFSLKSHNPIFKITKYLDNRFLLRATGDPATRCPRPYPCFVSRSQGKIIATKSPGSTSGDAGITPGVPSCGLDGLARYWSQSRPRDLTSSKETLSPWSGATGGSIAHWET